MKNNRFANMFQLLDSNGDGLISAQKIDISQLTPEVLKIMTPLFCEMEEMGQTLDMNEFIDAAKLLYNTLSVSEKNKLLAINHRWEIEREYNKIEPSFEPQVNRKSAYLAMKNREPGKRIEDILIEKRKETEERLQRMRELKLNEEPKGCTFHPKIINSPTEYRPVFHNLTQYDANVMPYIIPNRNFDGMRPYIPSESENEDSEAY